MPTGKLVTWRQEGFGFIQPDGRLPPAPARDEA